MGTKPASLASSEEPWIPARHTLGGPHGPPAQTHSSPGPWPRSPGVPHPAGGQRGTRVTVPAEYSIQKRRPLVSIDYASPAGAAGAGTHAPPTSTHPEGTELCASRPVRSSRVPTLQCPHSQGPTATEQTAGKSQARPDGVQDPRGNGREADVFSLSVGQAHLLASRCSRRGTSCWALCPCEDATASPVLAPAERQVVLESWTLRAEVALEGKPSAWHVPHAGEGSRALLTGPGTGARASEEGRRASRRFCFCIRLGNMS